MNQRTPSVFTILTVQMRLFRRCDSRTLPIKTFSLFITVTKTPIGPRHSVNHRNTSGSSGSSNVEDAMQIQIIQSTEIPLDTVPTIPPVLFF